jgi:hypothetical protein
MSMLDDGRYRSSAFLLLQLEIAAYTEGTVLHNKWRLQLQQLL